MYNNLHYNEPVSLTIQNWHWRNNEKFLPFVTFLTRFKLKFPFFFYWDCSCVLTVGRNILPKKRRKNDFKRNWNCDHLRLMWIFDLDWQSQSCLISNSKEFSRVILLVFEPVCFFLTRKNIREGKSCNSLKVHQQFMIRFRLPELLSRDS